MERILIVDDNPKNIQLLGNILDDNNFEVEYALNGQDALDILKSESFDLILLDIMMPEMDGFETCKRIKQMENRSQIPLIFLTAKTDPESITKAFNTGAIDYLTKPFIVEELLVRIRTHISLKRSEKKLEEINKNLEEKVRERTVELAASNKALKTANKELAVLDHSKNEFLKLINHEIRTPLNGILGFSGIIKDFVKDDIVAESIDALDLSCKRLEEFSFLALYISKINTLGAKALFLERYELNLIIMETLASVQKDLGEKKLQVKIQTEKVLAEIDIKYLFRCMKIIISNAAKYSPVNGKITISGISENDHYIIKVQDEGPGFPKVLLEQGINLFLSQHVDRNPGIELYFCKLVAEAHKGYLNIKNQNGALVELYIPVNPDIE